MIMKFKKMAFGVLISGILMFLLAGSGFPQEKYTMKFAFPGPLAFEEGKFGEWMCKEVEKRSNGRIKAEYFHGGQMGGTMEISDKLEKGILQGASMSASHTSNINPLIGVLNLPFLINSYEDADKLMKSSLGQRIYDGLAKVGVTGVDITEFGMYSIGSIKKFKTFDELQKMRLKSRAPDSLMHIEIHKALGLRPAPMPFNEVYTSLQQGVIDCLDTSPEVIKAAKFNEVTKFLYMTNHFYGAQLIWFNTEWLNRLPKDLKEIVVNTVHEGAAVYRKAARDKEAALLKEYKSGGVEVFYPSAEELSKFKKATQKVHDQYKDKIGEKYLNQVYELLKYKK